MSVVSTYVTADVDDLTVSRTGNIVVIHVAEGSVLFLGPDRPSGAPKADALRVLAHLTALVQALPDDEVTA